MKTRVKAWLLLSLLLGSFLAIAGCSSNNDPLQLDRADYVCVLSAGSQHSVGLTDDGTVVAVGNNEDGRCNVSGWRNIVSISAGGCHTVGLKADGTVVATGDNKYGQCNVNDWTDIVCVEAGFHFTVGLKADGTVVAVGNNDNGQCNVKKWKQVVAIHADSITLGLKADGTVFATGGNRAGQTNVKNWKDIVAICAGETYSVGMTKDGSFEYTAAAPDELWKLKNVVQFSANCWGVYGVTPDGRVVTAGNDKTRLGKFQVSHWDDIVAVSVGFSHCLGLKKDGTVVSAGDNEYGECNVDHWKLK